MSTNESINPPMKNPPVFQIKVALIGNVSAGKTTVVNALFRDKYGEVSMKRTTAGVNEFAVCNRQEWAFVADEPRDSHSVLKEITQDNVELRASDQVKTKRFEIELEEPLCEMRKDTQLVIVDIPGINEANASQKYKTYVEDNWNTFDCVVVVMDGRQGVNTECQVSLLQFVKSNLESKKNVPVVILCNKIDDQDDEEQEELVLEAQHEVEKIFGVPDRQKSLQEVLQACGSTKKDFWWSNNNNNKKGRKKKTAKACETITPVFIPISGITAFIFQTCSNMSLERFREFDEKLIAKLGRERIGKSRWKKLSKEEQIKEAHEAVSDPEGYKEGVADSNFDKFLKVLSILVGGENVQQKMIEEQIQVSLATMPSGPGIVKTLEIAYKKLMGLSQDELNCYRAFSLANGWNAEADRSVAFFKNAVRRFLATTDSTAGFVEDLKVVYTAMKEFSLEAEDSPTVQILKETFEKSFEKLTTEAFTEFTSTDTVQLLSVLADELVVYNSLAIEAGWTSERSAVGTRFKGLVLKQICTLVELACKDCSPQGISYGKYSESRAFADFSWLDWKLCLRSILLLRYDRQFCFDFGREMVLIECLLEINPRSEATVDYNNEKCPQCNRCLDFNRVCTYCRALVNPNKSKCLAGNCSSQLSHYSGAYCYRCRSCCRHQIRACANDEAAVKQFCPNCLDQQLDYNRRCFNCKVFFRPEPEHKVTPVCPWDGSKLEESSGKCHSCGLVWKYFPKPTRSVKCDGNRFTLPGKQFELAVEVSSSLSDPNHFGHLAWRYCEFMATATEGQRG